jgi:hypothetical protein
MDSPSLNRAAIWGAVAQFFANITDANGTKVLKSFYTHAKHWIDVPAELQPSGTLDPTTEKRTVRRGMPPKIEMTALLRIYVATGADIDPTVDANGMLNPIIDAIEAALQIDDVINEACTLGGLVSHCAIDGKLERFSGTLGNEAVVVIPIIIIVSP